MKAYRISGLLILWISTVLAVTQACERVDDHHHHDDGDEHDHEYHSITYWGEGLEVLVNFEPHSSRIEGTLYLSNTRNQPIAAEEVELRLIDSEEEVLDEGTFDMEAEGLYPFELNHDGSHRFSFSGNVVREDFRTRFETDRFDTDSEPDGSGIRFSKERQWMLGVATRNSERRRLYDVISAPGEAQVDKNYYVQISAPVAGHMDAGYDQGLAVDEGELVSSGDRLATLAPALKLEDGWVERKTEVLQAEEEFARAERLRENGAISSREYELRKREYEAQQAVFDHFTSESRGDGHDIHLDFNDDHVDLLAPIDGVVGSIESATGATIDEGDPIITLFDSNRLRLDLQAYPDDIENLEAVRGISWKTRQSAERRHLDEEQLAQVTPSGSSGDGIRRTLHVKPGVGVSGLFPGQKISARIYHGEGNEVLAVPESALFDQDAYEVVFVQTSGDRFEQRIVTTGNRFDGWAEIRTGLEEGERVVSRATYPVYLESGNVEISDDHDH